MGSIIVATGDITDTDEPREGSGAEVAGFAVWSCCRYWSVSPTTMSVCGEVPVRVTGLSG
jgi:hypothetical protein